MNVTIAQASIAAAAASTNLDRLGVAHHADEDVVAAEGNWFFEVEILPSRVVFAHVLAANGEAGLHIDVRDALHVGEPIDALGSFDHVGLLPGATIAALIAGAVARATALQRLG